MRQFLFPVAVVAAIAFVAGNPGEAKAQVLVTGGYVNPYYGSYSPYSYGYSPYGYGGGLGYGGLLQTGGYGLGYGGYGYSPGYYGGYGYGYGGNYRSNYRGGARVFGGRGVGRRR